MPTQNPPNIQFLVASGAWSTENPTGWKSHGNIVSTNGAMHSLFGTPTTSPFREDIEAWSFIAQLPMGFSAKISLQRQHHGDTEENDAAPKAWQIHLKHDENVAHGVSNEMMVEQFQIWVRHQLAKHQHVPNVLLQKTNFRAILEQQISIQESRIQDLCERAKRAIDRKDFEVALEATLETIKARTAREVLVRHVEIYDDLQKGRH